MEAVTSELEATQDRLRAAEVVIMALFHRIDNLERLMKQQNAMLTFEARELKYEPEGLRLVIKDVQTWD